MNRIYQGRVTRVEILNGKKGEPQPLDDWQEKLWQHHELFQDAVNYYTLALAAMAGGLRPTDSEAREREIRRLKAEQDSLEDEAKIAKKAKDDARKEEIAKQEQQVKEKIDRLQREDAVWLWREQVRKAWEEGVERGAQRFVWNRETLARMLKKLDPNFHSFGDFEACCKTVLKTSKAMPQLQVDALLRLLALAGKKKGDAGAALTPLCTDKIVWFCSRPEDLDATDDVEKSVAERAAWEFANLLKDTKDGELESLAAKLKPAVFMTRERGEILKGKDAIGALLAYFKQLQKHSPELKAARSAIAQKVRNIRALERKKEAPSEFAFQLPKARVGMDYKAAKVFKVLPHQVVAAVFRKQTELLAKKKTVEIVDRDPLKDARTEANQPHFDYFSNLAFIAPAKPATKLAKKRKVAIAEDEDDDSDENRANWFEFDLAAFVEALKSPHRHYQDTLKRKDECEQLEKRLKKMRGAGESGGEEGEEDTSDRIEGFAGDHRIGLDTTIPGKKGVLQLIHDEKLLAYREDDDAGEIEEGESSEAMKCPVCGGRCEGYGVNENTLRGWSELRRRWREAADKDEFKSEANKEALLKELERIRREEQGDRPEEAGSGPLFKRLAEVPEYHCIWKDPPTKDAHPDDPLWAWVRYREDLLEWERLKNEPIRFTPAHPTESPRFFSFPKQNRPKAKAPSRGKAAVGRKSDHLPGMFAYDDAGEFVPVQGNEPWLGDRPRFMAFNAGLVVNNAGSLQPASVRIYYSAPRLRRDRIRSDTEQSLGDISLLQPMLEALGVTPNVPNINFANCSVRLSAARRERPNERAAYESQQEQKQPDRYDLHLEFPVMLDADELKNHELFRHAIRWNRRELSVEGRKFTVHDQFNFSGGDDKYVISLRWPSDREFSPRQKAEPVPWYQTMDGFCCLPLDLGQREGGAYAVLDVRASADFGTNKSGKPIPSRFIGQSGEKIWRVALAASGLLKLPGEDASAYRPRLKADDNTLRFNDPSRQDSESGKRFREEPWGDEGRPPLRLSDPGALIDETEQARELLGKDGFDQLDIMSPGWDKRREKERWGDPNTELTFPEQNDRLIIAARRYLSRVRRLHRWCAFLNPDNWPGKPDKAKQKRERALQEIREACGLDDKGVAKQDEKTNAPLEGEAWLTASVKRFVESGADDSSLAEVLKKLLEPMLVKLTGQFETLANRCVPLRPYRDHRDGPLYGSWRWTEHTKSTAANPLHILLPTGQPRPNARMTMPHGKEQSVTWIRGQRGLSMKRIGQLEDLRRLFQSLNHIQRRKIGTMPPRRKRGERGDELPDCCPKLLEKLDAMKEQRVNQLAHQVLALALGLRLKTSGPTKGDVERGHSDIHGEYERIPGRRPVDFIVLEDLKYYETTRVRSRRENVRLMRWCRRHFRDKLRQLCDVFGIPVVEANPANTSKFCARTGVAGFRAVEVGPGFWDEYVWRKALEKLDQYRKGKKLEPDDVAFCEGAEKLRKQVEEAQQIRTKSGKPLPCPRTLLAPLGSGNVFVPVVGEMNGADLPPAVVQADVNAAVMLGLRAIADPRLWEIHPRLRTKPPEKEKKSRRGKKGEPQAPRQNPNEKPFPPELYAAEKRKFGDSDKKPVKLDLTNASQDGALKDSRKPYFFRDLAGIAHWDKAVIPDPKTDKPVSLPSGKALWSAVKKLQWQRCLAINEARLKAWRDKLC